MHWFNQMFKTMEAGIYPRTLLCQILLSTSTTSWTSRDHGPMFDHPSLTELHLVGAGPSMPGIQSWADNSDCTTRSIAWEEENMSLRKGSEWDTANWMTSYPITWLEQEEESIAAKSSAERDNERKGCETDENLKWKPWTRIYDEVYNLTILFLCIPCILWGWFCKYWSFIE